MHEFHINSPSVAFSIVERNVERERGGDKFYKQIPHERAYAIYRRVTARVNAVRQRKLMYNI